MTLQETDIREYKSQMTDDIEKSVVAFLNTKGGELWLGVDADGIACGLTNYDKEALAFIDRIKNNIYPSALGLFTVTPKLGDNNKEYLVIKIASGYEKPFYIRKYGMTPKGCYARIGTQNSQMSQDIIDVMYARRISRTLQTVISPRQNLSFQQLKIFYQEKGHNANSDYFLKNLDLFTEDGKYNYAAYLMSDNNSTFMRVVKYAGKDKTVILNKQELGSCCLIKSAYNMLNCLNMYNETAIEITYPNRIETRLVDHTALREATLNSILHNDYINGAFPVVEFYSDRVEITSTGGLPSGLTEKEFFAGRSLPRNREIMRVFVDMELGEHLGSGMQRIMSIYKEDDFVISPNFVTAVFKYDERVLKLLSRDKTVNESSTNYQRTTNELSTILARLNKTQKRILELISGNEFIKIAVLAADLGISTRAIDKNVKQLKDKGLLKRIGDAKNGYYKVTWD
ncbi:MAG: putative DNA binding domain-containing protein [Erysipelotrichales bacterium]|nr:putative DNA binding domain-containing protein [Erysipelotrichales bacterium]